MRLENGQLCGKAAKSSGNPAKNQSLSDVKVGAFIASTLSMNLRALPLRYRQILRGLGLGLAVNVGLLVIGQDLPVPTQNIKVTTLEDGLLLFGQNRYAMNVVHHFSTWQSFEAYLGQNNLQMPVVNHSEVSVAQAVQLRHRITGTGYRVTWRHGVDDAVIHAPDLLTAKYFADFLRYSRLEPSPYGFAISFGENPKVFSSPL